MRSPVHRTRPGQPESLGGLARRGGANFAVEAPHAERVEVCLFHPGAPVEYGRWPMYRDGRGRFHLWIHGLRAGQLYGYRVHGPFDPDAGHYFNANKLLLDPWCRQVAGPLRFEPSHCIWTDLGERSDSDSAPGMLRSVVVAPHRPPAIHRPRVPIADTVLYECHVRGMTARHPEVPEPLRGTFLGLCQRAVIQHLKSLSVTTLSLLPVAACYDEAHLVQKGLTNYWGYAPVCPFAPSPRYATSAGDPAAEFRQMVDELHREGLEVVLDVVFNHTAEGAGTGVILSYRGLDSLAFYATSPEPPRAYVDHTGCGNSLDLGQPTCLRHVLDALRFWAVDMGVDGFRFDLATTLSRTAGGFAVDSPFLSALMQDPVLRELKLIAEPWDVGWGGYQLGAFPPGFSEWNDRYRDGLRRFFRGEPGCSAELATRLSGSSDLFGGPLRGPTASVNFVTAHDGFTLIDLVSYEERHNEANGEDNRDGHHANFSQNFGHEGPVADAAVMQQRMRTARAMLTCLAVSHGVPMIGHGDELGRTQLGNNNAYCQDNPLTYVDWEAPWQRELLPFMQCLMALRQRHPCLRPLVHMHGAEHAGRPDLTWLRSDGAPLNGGDEWADSHFAMRVCGELGDGVLVLLNGGDRAVRFTLPEPDPGHAWVLVVEAARGRAGAGRATHTAAVPPRSATLFELQRGRAR